MGTNQKDKNMLNDKKVSKTPLKEENKMAPLFGVKQKPKSTDDLRGLYRKKAKK